NGFTSAAALIIAFSQVRALTGIELDRSSLLHEILIDLTSKFTQVHPLTLAIGLTAVLFLFLQKKFFPKLPGPLILVVVAISLSRAFQLDQLGVKVVGSIPAGLPWFALPDSSLETIRQLFPMAMTIGLISFVESMAISRSLPHKDELRSNQELISLGLAKVVGALFQSYVNTGSFSRSVINHQAGAQTTLAGLFAAFLVGACLLFFTQLFYYLPQAALGALIMVSVIKLVDIRFARKLWRSQREDFYMLLATFVATMVLGIQYGILIGVLLSLVLVVYHSAYPHVAVLGKIPGTRHFRNIKRFAEAEQRDDVLILRFDAQLFYANADFFQAWIRRKVKQKGKALKLVVLNGEAIHSVDATALQALDETARELEELGVQFYFAAFIGPVRDSLYRFGFMEKMGRDHFYLHVGDALLAFDSEMTGTKPPIQPRASQVKRRSEP
ncbi:MAG: SulP family inorganic anion transporter, partial [Bacteroidota bacterium]